MSGLIKPAPRHYANKAAVTFTGILAVIILLTPISSHGSQQMPTIISVDHHRLVGGDSLCLTANGPFPKPFINSSSENIELEYTGIDCTLTPGDGQPYSTDIQGNLTDHLDVSVDGKPPVTRVAVSIPTKSDYTYSYVKHSDREIELLITSYPAKVQPDASGTIKPASPEPPTENLIAPKEAAPPKTQPSDIFRSPFPGPYVITTVEYFPIEGDGDRIEFTFKDYLTDPVITTKDYPPRIELIFKDAEVRFPAQNKYGPFLTPVPGLGMSTLKAWNRNSGSNGSVFELYLAEGVIPKWKVSRQNPKYLWVDVTYEEIAPVEESPTDGVQPKLVEEPSIEIEAYFVGGTGGKPGPVEPSQIVKLQEMELEINWPDDAEKLMTYLMQITAGVGPGVVVEIPLKLKLHIHDEEYDTSDPKMER